MSAIVGLRLGTYVRAYHAIAPMIGGLVVLSILYGGGVARPEEAYGVSAVVLFPVMAWQVKILLDAEPDVQRRLLRVATGAADREIAAGLLASAATAVPTVIVGLVLPWLFGGVGTGAAHGQAHQLGLGAALVFGLWAHLLAIPPAVAVGAWASRPVARTAGTAVSVLAGGSVAAIVFSLSFSPVPWLVPPLLPTARVGASGLVTLVDVVRLTSWSLLWSAVALAGYWALRRRRA